MPESTDRPVQHTPVHLRDDTPEVFDPRHPAASSFAPLQPAAGVVADDVEERGQNLAGGQKASDAQAANFDQREKLQAQYRESLEVSVPTAPAPKVEGDTAKPASSEGGGTTPARSGEDKSTTSSAATSRSRGR